MSDDMYEVEIVVRSEARPKPTMHDPDRMERESVAQLRIQTSESIAYDVYQEALASLTGGAKQP